MKILLRTFLCAGSLVSDVLLDGGNGGEVRV